jgi:hypothetical protein
MNSLNFLLVMVKQDTKSMKYTLKSDYVASVEKTGFTKKIIYAFLLSLKVPVEDRV